MTQKYNQFRILNYDLSNGSVEVFWYDEDAGPINEQQIYLINHSLPIEVETANMDRETLYKYLIIEAPRTVPVMPEWIKEEAKNTSIDWQQTKNIVIHK